MSPKIFSTQLAAALKEAQLGFKAALDAVRVCEHVSAHCRCSLISLLVMRLITALRLVCAGQDEALEEAKRQMAEARTEQAAELKISLERQEQESAKRVAELLQQQKEEQKEVSSSPDQRECEEQRFCVNSGDIIPPPPPLGVGSSRGGEQGRPGRGYRGREGAGCAGARDGAARLPGRDSA